ncbi:hypothetical protein ACFP3Q_08880 [Nocardioides sp. GCM10027113]|uniref:hypothetical protein n=1 Tax=unclassified Nocardioides TaxID=2615069 RepID=UPI00360F7457
MESDRLAFVDEHSLTVEGAPERVWAALREYAASLHSQPGGPAARLITSLLGTDPAPGFEVAEEVPNERLTLVGRHRFARYRLDFAVGPGPGVATILRATTHADFPGLRGRAYRLLVVGSRGHVLAVRHMLREVQRRASLS